MKELNLWILILCIVLLFPVIYNTKNDVSASQNSPATSASTIFNAKNYEESISNEAMCNLSAEASDTKIVKDLFSAFMPIKNNIVDGWIHVYEEYKESGLSFSFWVNKYDSTTYALVFSGTDEFKDTLQYVPMETSKNFSTQMIEAITATKNIQTYIDNKKSLKPQTSQIYGDVNKLFITGHSLGGYLSMFVTSEIIDSALKGQASRIDISEVSTSLEISNLKCITFGAPGMYSSGTCKIAGITVNLTAWQQRKVQYNNDKLYDPYIVQYVNSLDPVGNLLPNHFRHLGRRVDLQVQKTSASTTIYFFKQKPLTFLPAWGASVYYHMPWVYIPLLEKL